MSSTRALTPRQTGCDALLEAQAKAILPKDSRRVMLKTPEGEREAVISAEAERAGVELIVRRSAERSYQRPSLPSMAHLPACRTVSVALTVANEARCLWAHVNETPLVAVFATSGTGDALIARHLTAIISSARQAFQEAARAPG